MVHCVHKICCLDQLCGFFTVLPVCFSRAIFFNFFNFFSVHWFFDVPEPILAKLCRTTRYVLKYSTSYRGVHTWSLTNLRGEKLQFSPICGPINRHFESRHSLMRGKSENLKQWGQSMARWGRPYQTWRGSPYPPLRSVVLLVCGVGQVNFESI